MVPDFNLMIKTVKFFSLLVLLGVSKGFVELFLIISKVIAGEERQVNAGYFI